VIYEHARRCVVTEWLPEHFSDVAVLLSKCEDVYSADVPSSLQVPSIHLIIASGQGWI